MADTKLSALVELAATPASDDEVYIRDVSEAAADESKRITITNLMAAVSGLPTIVRKTADEIVNNSTTLQNDDHLLLAVGANEVWLIDLILLLIQANAAADWKYKWAYPTGTTMFWAEEFSWSYPQTTLFIETNTGNMSSALTAITGLMIRAIVIVGGTAGTLNFQWAQSAATVANNTIKANSCLIAHKLA